MASIAWPSFLAVAFPQLRCRESLRDIEVNMRGQAKRLYHRAFAVRSRATYLPARTPPGLGKFVPIFAASDRHHTPVVPQRALRAIPSFIHTSPSRHNHVVRPGCCADGVLFDQGLAAAPCRGQGREVPARHSNNFPLKPELNGVLYCQRWQANCSP